MAQRPGFKSTHILSINQRIFGIGLPYSTSAADIDTAVDNRIIRLVDIASNADNIDGTWLTMADWSRPDMIADGCGPPFGAGAGSHDSAGGYGRQTERVPAL